ncbi:histidine kinase [Microtetraspora sp. NBRC 13810]|uniref:sensor histidine kinase n=1 Tax=Microtetraspora sp. NBRC 13810 TaxID=3030990 RepID=UPI0024A459F8|nr:nitrate- and nitrite sensing domain-containing protein [Microtetraspora sp. NBRC 13810]GLW09991.1 histidine kinase [Microtetraspora sp. NBRC 13810]
MLLLPLLCLSALWGFVLNLTVGDGAALLRAGTVDDAIGVPFTDLGHQLQNERARSAIAISSRVVTSELGVQRTVTDRAVKRFRESALSEDASEAITPELRVPLDGLLKELDRLPDIRNAIDADESGRLEAVTAYNRILDQSFRVYDQLAAVPDLAIFQQGAAAQAMRNVGEIVARENALVSGALIDRRMSRREHDAFVEYVSARKLLQAKGMSALDAQLRGPYQNLLDSTGFKQFTDLEQEIIRESATGELPPDADRWRTLADDLAADFDRLDTSTAGTLRDRADSVATAILVRIAIAGGLGLIAVVASIIISIRFGRRLATELAGLRRTAMDLANVRLPRVVDRLRRGEEVNVDAEVSALKAGGSLEVRDVARAFATVQHTAIEAAVGQANLRRGVGLVFLNLARRKQTLLHRQLALLDGMQRRTDDPDILDDLFKLDHLTTRMRRHAEGLIILSGAVPGRAWRNPVPVVDILRAAVAEVEDYKRVTVYPTARAALLGESVADITHLVAELIENATLYSSSDSTVNVRGDTVANGFAIEVEDRGLGLLPEEYAAINARLANPPEFDLADSDRLGLFVVGRLAARHGVHVILRASPYGGTTAIVLIPRALLVEAEAPATPALTGRQEGSPAEAPTPLQQRATSLPARRERGARDNRIKEDRPRYRRTGNGKGGSVRVGEDAGGASTAVPSGGDLFTPRSTGPAPAEAGDPAAPGPGAATGPSTGPEISTDEPTDPQPPARRPNPSLTVVTGPAEGTPPPLARRTRRTVPPPVSAEPAPEAQPHEGAEGPRRAAPPAGTHAGLPRRVKQANLAPQLRKADAPADPAEEGPQETPATTASAVEEEGGPGETGPASGPAERSPDQARAVFSAFQQGARRGREDADYVHQTTGDKRDE